MVYAAARRCICRAKVSSGGSSLFTRNWRMGWAHEGAAISSTVKAATWTRVAGLRVGGLEFVATCWINEVPGPTGAVPGPSSGVFSLAAAVPGPSSEVPGLAATAALLKSSATGLVLFAWALGPDPASSGGVGTKIESDSGEGLMDGLRRRWRATPEGIAWRVEPIRAKVSAWLLSFLGTWRNSHPSKYPLSCCTRKR